MVNSTPFKLCYKLTRSNCSWVAVTPDTCSYRGKLLRTPLALRQSFNSIHSTLKFSRFRSYRIPHPRHRTRTIELHTGMECSRAHPRARTALSLHTSSVSMALVLSYVTRRSHSSPWTASLSSGERRQSPFNVAFAKA